MKARGGGRIIDLLSSNLGPKGGWIVNATRRQFYPMEIAGDHGIKINIPYIKTVSGTVGLILNYTCVI